MIPLILVHSYGQENSTKIIKDILHANGGDCEEITTQVEDCSLAVCKCNIITKYYETEIGFFEWDDLESIPNSLSKHIEGCIIYFDADCVTFNTKIDFLNKFVKTNNIGFPCILTRNISKKESMDTLRQKCASSKFAVCDLNSEDDYDDGADKGYGEVIEMLKNNVWSNVIVDGRKLNLDFNNLPSEDNSDESVSDDSDIENQLNEFENLMNNLQQFKTMSQNLSRDELLDNAEKLAEQFANILAEH